MKTIVKNILILTFMVSFNYNMVHAAGFDRGSEQVKVTVHLPDTLKEDSLQLVVFEDNYLAFSFLKDIRVIQTVAPVTDGICTFKLTIDKGPKCFVIRKMGGTLHARSYLIVEKNLIESGDSVHINLSNNNVSFTGNGSEKMREVYLFGNKYSTIQDSISRSIPEATDFANKEMGYAYHTLKASRSTVDYWINRLAFQKGTYSAEAYGFLMAEFVGRIQETTMFAMLFKAMYSGFSPSEIIEIRGWVKNALLDLNSQFPDTVLSKSPSWMRYCQKLGQFESYTNKGHTSAYDYFKTNYSGKLKDRILTDYLFRAQGNTSSDSLFRDAVTVIKDPYYLSEIASFLKKQESGERAADFSLLNRSGEVVRLSDFKGKVVFLDFWFVGCSFCKSYFKKAVQPAEEFFKSDTSVVFISICVEKDREKWMKIVEENTYTSEYSVNLFTGSLAWLHPVIKQYAVASAPKPLLIGKNGLIYTRSEADLGRPKAIELIQTIQECLAQ